MLKKIFIPLYTKVIALNSYIMLLYLNKYLCVYVLLSCGRFHLSLLADPILTFTGYKAVIEQSKNWQFIEVRF